MFEHLYQAIVNAISSQQNQFLSAGLILGTLTAILASARRLPAKLFRWLQNRLIITLEITNEDPSFFWLAAWLARQPYSNRSRNLSVTTYRDSYGNLKRGNDEEPTLRSDRVKRRPPEVHFTPAPGNHLFLYKGRPIWLQRERKDQVSEAGSSIVSFFSKESFKIRMFGRSQATARALVEEARDLSYVEKEAETDIYVYASYDGFRKVDSCSPRPLSSVFLPQGQVEDLVKKIRTFLDGKTWYQSRGIPWRLGFLFHGLPGSGKTSLIRALTGHFKMDLYLLNLANIGDDNRFAHALASIPPRSAILLEELDTTFDKRKRSADAKGGITFAGVVNALDGAASREGWLVFMTTNFKEKLDPALIRPGRADVHLEFGYATAYQGYGIFKAFFPDSEEAAQTFGRLIEARAISRCARSSSTS